LRPLLLGAILVAGTNLLFSAAGAAGRGGAAGSLFWLALVISADNLSGGIASTAFIAYLSSLTHRSYTATQYALFSSLMTLPGKFLSGFSAAGWSTARATCCFSSPRALGLPAILLVLVLMRRDAAQPASPDSAGGPLTPAIALQHRAAAATEQHPFIGEQGALSVRTLPRRQGAASAGIDDAVPGHLRCPAAACAGRTDAPRGAGQPGALGDIAVGAMQPGGMAQTVSQMRWSMSPRAVCGPGDGWPLIVHGWQW
jgi:hypothetical protein